MDEEKVPETERKRADKLSVGDRIPAHCLPTAFFKETGEVVFVRTYAYRGEGFVFVAYWQEVGYDSTTYLANKDVEVIPIDPPEGFVPASAPQDGRTGEVVTVPPITRAAVTQNCVFTGDIVGWCETHQAVHIASGEGECGCPVYPFAGRGDAADTIIDHHRACLASAD